MHEAAESAASLVVFPELGLSSYICDDLFHQRALLDPVIAGLARFSQHLSNVISLLSWVVEQSFSIAALSCKNAGYSAWCRVYLPNYREFYESRQFNPAQNATVRELELCGQGNMRSARM